MSEDTIYKILIHPIFALFVAFIFAALAASGRLNMNLSNILLFIAFLIGCFGVYRLEVALHFGIILCLSLAILLVFISWWIQPSGLEVSAEGTAQFNSVYLPQGGIYPSQSTIVSNYGWFVQSDHVQFTAMPGAPSTQYFLIRSSKKQLNINVSTDYPKDSPIFITTKCDKYKLIPGGRYLISTTTGEIK